MQKDIFVSAILILNSINETQHAALSLHDKREYKVIQHFYKLAYTFYIWATLQVHSRLIDYISAFPFNATTQNAVMTYMG